MARENQKEGNGLMGLNPVRIALCYFVVGVTWILLSDRAADWLFRDNSAMLLLVSSTKGFAFVSVTTALLYWLLRNHVRALLGKESELRKSQQLYRLVVENAPEGILMHDADRFLFANAEAAKLFGAASPQELVGRPVMDFVHPDYQADVARRMGLLLDHSQPARLREQLYRRLDGTSIEVEVTGVPFSLGDMRGGLVFIRDIGQRKKAERELRESEAKYRLLADNAHDLIFTFDAAWRPTFVSPSVERLRGVSVQEAMTESFEDMMLPASAAKAREQAARFEKLTGADRNIVESLDVEMRRKDGGSVWMEAVVRPLFDKAGVWLGVIGVGREITERRRIEEDLHRSREFLRMILEAIPDPVFVKDSDHRFVQVNGALCAMLGQPAEAIIGKADKDFVAAEEAEVFIARDNLVLETGKEDIFEERFTDNQGLTHIFVTRKGLFIDASGGRFIVGVIRDVTADKRNEQRLRDSLLEKEVLLKEVHHRVKNNLQVISSLLFLQKDTIEDPAIQDIFEESRNRISSMALIHEELYRSGDLARVDLKEYLERLTPKVVQSLRGGRAIGFALDLEECRVPVDKAIPFGLIINELVTNAVKHAFVDRDTGTIRVTVAREGEMVRAAVEDDGLGLGQDFHPDAVKSLGMQLVIQLTRQLRGALTFGSSAPGAVFRLTFPLHDAAA